MQQERHGDNLGYLGYCHRHGDVRVWDQQRLFQELGGWSVVELQFRRYYEGDNHKDKEVGVLQEHERLAESKWVHRDIFRGWGMGQEQAVYAHDQADNAGQHQGIRDARGDSEFPP